MGAKYAKHVSRKATPQNEPIPGKTQVKNAAGGYVYEIDKWQALDRFLILGTEGGTYYAGERELTIQNVQSIGACLTEDGPRVVRRAIEVSDGGLAPKNDPAIFVLALAFGSKDEATIKAAREALPKICRIGTHLFTFTSFVKELRGWGPALRKALGAWYLGMPAKRLVYQLTKYQQRNGWSHRDVLRLAHPKAKDPEVNSLLGYVAKKGSAEALEKVGDTESGKYLRAIHALESMAKGEEVAQAILEHRLPREVVPTRWLTDVEVQKALMEGAPLTAMIRNLGNWTKSGALKPLSKEVTKLCEGLTNEEWIKKSRIHPIQILMALKTYAGGRSLRGLSSWVAIPQIVEALNDAFYASFKFLAPTNKRILIALDVSGSMGSPVSGIEGLSCRDAAAAMAMSFVRTEKNIHVVSFSDNGGKDARSYLQTHSTFFGTHSAAIDSFPLSKSERLDDVVAKMEGLDFGGTDCALPMIYAINHELEVDAFIVATDNETWAGKVHPSQALEVYRNKSGIKSKIVGMAMTATNYSILDKEDPLALNVVGLDASAPSLVSAFLRDEF